MHEKMACEVRGDGATSGRLEASGETWVTSEPTPDGHLTSYTRTKRAARRLRQRERRRTFRRAGAANGKGAATTDDATRIAMLEDNMDKLSTMLLKVTQQNLQPSIELANLSTLMMTTTEKHAQIIMVQHEEMLKMGQAIDNLMDRVGQLEQRPTLQDNLGQQERQSAQQPSEQQLRAHSTQRQPTSTPLQSMTQSTDEPKTAADFHDNESAMLVAPELARMEPECNAANQDEHTAAATTTTQTATATATTKAAMTATTARWTQHPLFTLAYYPQQADCAEFCPEKLKESCIFTFVADMWRSRLSAIDRTMHGLISGFLLAHQQEESEMESD